MRAERGMDKEVDVLAEESPDRHPDEWSMNLCRDDWVRLLAWARDSMATASPVAALARKYRDTDEAVQASILRKLKSTRIDLDFTQSDLYDIVDYMQEFGNLNICIQVEIRKTGLPERQVDFVVTDMVIGEALTRLLALCGLEYSVTSRMVLVR